MGAVKMLMGLLIISVGVEWAGAEVHHVVGAERGWDPYTDMASWSSGRNFRVGDKIWFTYHAAQGAIAELKSKEEYEACDVSNPIRMFVDGVDAISLDGEGIRYFANRDSEKCKSGLKLEVEVMAEETPGVLSDAVAAGPTPSGAQHAHLGASFALSVAGFWLLICYVWAFRYD